MPDTPTVTPLVDVAYAAVMTELERQQIAGEATEISGLANWHSIIRVILAALRPVEAYDAGLIGELETCAGQSELGRNLAGTPQVCRRAAARLASLSAAKVEAEKAWDFPKSWEISWGALDGDPSDCAWRVHDVRGGRSDREWTLLATGETALEAVTAALKGRAQGDGR